MQFDLRKKGTESYDLSLKCQGTVSPTTDTISQVEAN